MPKGVYSRTAEHKANMSVEAKIRWANPEYRASLSKPRRRWDGITPMLGSHACHNQITEETFWDLMTGAEYTSFMCGRYLELGECLVVDHDHLTGEVRGIVHSNCNIKYERRQS